MGGTQSVATPRQRKPVVEIPLNNINIHPKNMERPHMIKSKKVGAPNEVAALLTKYPEPITLDNGGIIQYYIPIGTKLYHGSLDFELTFDDKCITSKDPNRLTFFGLDIIISLWYLEEVNRLKFGYKYKYGVIYELVVIEDIPVYRTKDHPLETYQCKDVACLHEEGAYHGDPYGFSEPSIELTMNLSKLPNKIRRNTKEIIRQNTKEEIPITYLVDLAQLKKVVEYGELTVRNFDPILPTNITGLSENAKQKLTQYGINQLQTTPKSVITSILAPKGGHRKIRRTQKRKRTRRRSV
jgi:hypothetical protein